MSAIGDSSEEDAKKHEEYAASVKEVQATLNAQTGEVTSNTKAWALQSLATSGALKSMNNLGLPIDKVTSAILGNGEAAESTKASINDMRLEALHGAEGYEELRAKADAAGIGQQELDRRLLTNTGMEELNAVTRTTAEGMVAGQNEMGGMAAQSELWVAHGWVTPQLDDLNRAEAGLDENTKKVNDAVLLQTELARAEAIVAGDLAGAVAATGRSMAT